MAKKWDYWVFDQRGGIKDDIAALNDYGVLGWELVSVIDYDGERRFFMKKSYYESLPE